MGTLGGGGAGWQAVRVTGLIPLHVEASVSVSPHFEVLDPSLENTIWIMVRDCAIRQVEDVIFIRSHQECAHYPMWNMFPILSHIPLTHTWL
jgi:hypothetical protein